MADVASTAGLTFDPQTTHRRFPSRLLAANTLALRPIRLGIESVPQALALPPIDPKKNRFEIIDAVEARFIGIHIPDGHQALDDIDEFRRFKVDGNLGDQILPQHFAAAHAESLDDGDFTAVKIDFSAAHKWKW